MKTDRITYQKLFPLGMYINERIGVEVQLDEWDDPAECLQAAKNMVEKFYRDSNPQVQLQFTDANEVLPEVQMENSKTSDRMAALIKDIDSCKEIKVLESYSLMAKISPELQAAYDYKMEQLIDKQFAEENQHEGQ